MPAPETLQHFAAVAAIGLAVGGTDLVSRYRDAPRRALSTFPAIAYLLINIGAACLALYLIQRLGLTFGAEEKQIVLRQVLVAGFGAMVFFRTSIFLTAVGEGEDGTVDVGPSSVLKAFLAAADRGVDRARAQQRASEVVKIMQGVDFAKAIEALPNQVLALLQNDSPEEQEVFGKQMIELKEKAANMRNGSSVMQLGLAIMAYAGPDVLQSAVASLWEDIRQDPQAVADTNGQQLLGLGPFALVRASG